MHQFILPDGTSLAYEWEPEGEGYPVVFLNGILMNLRSWKGQSSPLSKSHPCLLHDFRGQLYSGKDFPEQWKMEGHAEDLEQLLDHLKIEQCHLVGTSYGGEVGLLFAKMRPERVRSLTVIASVPWSDALLKRQVRLWRDLAGVDYGLLYDAVVTCSYSGDFLERTGGYFDSYKVTFSALPPEFFKGFEYLCDAFLGFEMSPESLKKIACPTLIISAGGDVLKTPAYSKAMQQHIPGAKYEAIDDAGHAVVIEAPRVITSYLEGFIGEHA